MLTEEQKQELRDLITSKQAQGITNADIQAEVDALKSQMLASNKTEEKVVEEKVVEENTQYVSNKDQIVDVTNEDAIIKTQKANNAGVTTNEFGVPLEKFKANEEEFNSVIESFKDYDKRKNIPYTGRRGELPPAYLTDDKKAAYDAWKEGKELKEVRDLLPLSENLGNLVDPKTGERVQSYVAALQGLGNMSKMVDRTKTSLGEAIKRSTYEAVGPEWADVIQEVLSGSSISEIGSKALASTRNDYSFIDPETNKKITKEEDEDRWKELNNAYDDLEFYKDRKGKLTTVQYDEKTENLLQNGPAYDYVKKMWNDSNKEVGKESNKGGKEYIQALEAIDTTMAYSGPSMEEAIKNKSFNQIVPALANAFATISTSVLPTIAATTATAFVTRNPAIASRVGTAMIGAQIGPSLWTNYNEEKAQRLYPELSKAEAFDKATKEGKLEFAVPAALILPSIALEKVGIKAITKIINKGSYTAKGLVVANWGALTETGTELAQLPIELLGTGLGKGLKDEKLAEFVWEGFKEQGVEVALQTYAGTLLFGAAGKGVKSAYKGVRNAVTPEHLRNTAANSIFTIGVLKQDEALETNPLAKKGIKKAIRLEKAKLTALVKEGNDLGSRLTADQLKKAATAEETIQSSLKNIESLEADLKSGKINQKSFALGKDGFYKDAKNARQVINRIVEKVRTEKQPVIRNNDGTLTTKYSDALQEIRRLSETRSSNEIALDEYKLKNNSLKEQKANNEISTEQFDAQVKENIENYKKKRTTTKENTVKLVKGVKESSIKSSEKLQEVFDSGLESGDITVEVDKKGKKRNVLNNKAINEILKTQGGFLKSLSNKVFGAIPNNLRIGTKPEYESNLNTELLKLLRTYNKDLGIPLGAYLQKNLPLRAISQEAFENISSQTFTKDVASAEVQGMIAEEDSEIDTEFKNIDTARDLNIGDDLMNTIKNVAKQALLTTKEKVDNLKFKTDIAKAFKNALYSDIKTQLSLKNTKTNKGLTNAIEANPDAFYDTMSVESMRKARGKDKNGNSVNPFEVAGFLENKNGVLEKVTLEDLGVDGFLAYITAPEVANNTRSDRQMHLVEALAVSMGAREAINLLENDVEFRQRFAEQQQQEQQKQEFNKAAVEVSVNKDKESFIQKVGQKAYEVLKNISTKTKNIGEVITALDLDYVGINDKTRVKIQGQVLRAIEKGNIPDWVFESAMFGVGGAVNSTVTVDDFLGKNNTGKKIPLGKIDGINFDTKDGRVRFKDKNGNFKPLRRYNLVAGGTILNNDPRFFLGTKINGVMQPGMDGLVAAKNKLYYGKSDPAYLTALAAAQENNKNNKDFSQYKTVDLPKKGPNDSIGTVVTEEFLNGKPQGSKISRKEQAAYNMDALEEMTKILSKAVNENGVDLAVVARFITGSFQATSGLIKVAAPFKIRSKNFEYGRTQDGASKDQAGLETNKKLKYREEHSPPASRIAASILFAISTDSVDLMFPSIRKNFFQTQLSKKDDVLIDNNKLSSFLPEGMTILDTNVGLERLVKSNIDLSSLIDIETGENLAKINKVEGPDTIDGKKASNNAFTANNSDQVENLIDRAIAKLTELTGTAGTLQMNLGSVPINILIGGLRATKLAYQGGKALSDAIAIGYGKVKDYIDATEWSDFVSKSTQEVKNQNNPAQVQLSIMNEAGVAKLQEQVRQGNYNILKEFGVDIDGLTTDEIIEKINILRKAKVVGSNTRAPKKKARVFDFDDTLAKTNSKVLYTLPDGTTGSLDATQFAEQFGELQEAGATFDYSEFSQVKDGSKGPLATLAKRFTEAKGDRDVFVLTARPADSAIAIQEFLRATLGISIPIQNITGLANGKPGAKAMWVAEKVSEGYNDVFFADDVAANVKAVADMLDNLGVTKRVQQAKESGQRNLEDEMDSLIRGKKRSTIGKFLSKINIYIPPGADDFAGLLKYFQAKGKLGDEQMKWFQDNLLTPFAQGISAYTSAKVALADDFTALNKRFKNGRTLGIPSKFRKMLSQKVLGGIYTNEQAVRAYLYDKAGEDLGLNKADTQDLIALVEGNGELKAYADAVSKITKLDAGYPPITEQWLGGSIATDMAVVSNKAQRAEFLQEFTNNKEQIFSDQNMKLIKQIYGNDYTDALSNILERMETGQNRKKGKDKEFNSAMNWINQSVGAVMAINMRSAILQQMSIVNYMNWNFNNPIKMGMAMANVPRFMKDYLMILNSDFLKERRGGMAIEVNLADIADSNPGNLFLRLNKKVLELGFKPTQWGDSNAIAFGGATWYRNRYNQLVEQGMSESEANSQAMLEFQEVSETAQQSSRVDKVSRQQASDIGRLILAFANTPLQYARETRKATSDLVNGRGDWKTNASKILYYGVAQNIIFTALQQGLFSLLLSDADDEEYEKTDKKLMYSLNGVADGMLRGMGYAGAVVAALKNLGMEYYDQRQKREKGERVYDGALKLVQKGLSISPPISKKIGDIVEGQKFETWKQYKNDPFYQGFAYANYFSGLTNLPADRVFKKIENLKAASQDSTEAWQSVFLALGWSPYNVGVDIEYNIPKSTGRKTRPIRPTRPTRPTRSPVPDRLPEGVLGRANKDGTMDIKPGLSAEKRKKVVAHEQVHLDQFKSGKLDYTDSDITWKGQKIPRTADSKIFYNGKLYIEGAKNLPWEKEANKLSRNKV